MKVLVTGGSGFLGGHVVPLLLERGHNVAALARSASAASRVCSLGAEPLRGDLDDAASLDAAFAAAEATALVNLASLGFDHAPAIVSAAEDAGLRRAVFVSTTAIFTSLPAASKAIRQAAEETIRASDLNWTIIRPTMIYGTPADRNMARLLRFLRRAPVVPLPGGAHLQQPVHVDDVAYAIVKATQPVAGGRSYDVAGPNALTFRDLVEQAAVAVGRRPRLVPIPLQPVISVMRAYQRLGRRPRLSAEQLERLGEDKAFSIDAARRDLGFDPRPFAIGIREEAALLDAR